jgi:transposase
MAKPLVDDELWALIQPLLPPHKPRRFRYPGRKRLDDRKTLTGIVFVLKSGIPWEMLPQEMGCGCGMTCWNRLHEWQQAGVWKKLYRLILERLEEAGTIDWSRAIVDSSSVRAVGAGEKKWPQSHGSRTPR